MTRPRSPVKRKSIAKGYVYTVGGKNIILVKQDITRLSVDAIVNAANDKLKWGGGVSGAIFNAAGQHKLETNVANALKGQNRVPVGSSIATAIPKSTAALPTINNSQQNVHWIFHAVGPDCRVATQKQNYKKLLQAAYKNSIELANHYQINSIAFPSISTAIFACPVDKAAYEALSVILRKLPSSTLKQVFIATIDSDTFNIYKDYLDTLK